MNPNLSNFGLQYQLAAPCSVFYVTRHQILWSLKKATWLLLFLWFEIRHKDKETKDRQGPIESRTHTHTHTHTRTHMFKRILLLSVETTSIPMCHVLWEQFGCFCICIQWVQWLYFVVTHLNISIVFAWVIFFQ